MNGVSGNANIISPSVNSKHIIEVHQPLKKNAQNLEIERNAESQNSDPLPSCLWKPDPKIVTNLDKFRSYVNRTYNKKFESYEDLYGWSVSEYDLFWKAWWKWGGFKASVPPTSVVEGIDINDLPKWFLGARLNFAENLLRFRDDRVAIYATGEGQEVKTLTYNALYDRTRRHAQAFSASGVQSGDRIAGYLPNGIAAVEGMLGAAAIGAVWSSTSPDFGVMGVLDRFTQISPSIIISVEAVVYNGKVHDHLAKLKQVVGSLPSVKAVIIAPFVHKKEDIDISDVPNAIFLDDFLARGDGHPFWFAEVPFSHPQFIMFSSGTTGAPKCIVHSVGGTLIQIAKEHILHCDLSRKDVFMYYTTTGWMMWNWMVAGLYTGCSLVLYDGSPLVPTPSTIWDVVDKLGITVLGTGAKWLSVLEGKGVKPKSTHDLSTLRAILSTGSPLAPSSFQYVYRDIKEDLMLGSITGGTDIISCFLGCNPTLPVFEGEIQCRLLGMAVEAFDPEGKSVLDQSGELVCTTPFPSMPTHFWKDEGHVKYTKAYFSKFPNIWTHGDFCSINSATGGVTMLGRSDGTLNPNGVRFGSAEIYNIVEHFEEVMDSMCVAQRNSGGEERVLLFLKLNEPDEGLSPDLKKRIQASIRARLSARHVPALILPIREVPYTVSGKKVEVAVRQVIHNEKVVNKGSLSNPDALDHYANIPELAGW